MSPPEDTIAANDAERRERLHRTWDDRPGLVGFLTTVDHKRIAARYVCTTMAV